MLKKYRTKSKRNNRKPSLSASHYPHAGFADPSRASQAPNASFPIFSRGQPVRLLQDALEPTDDQQTPSAFDTQSPSRRKESVAVSNSQPVGLIIALIDRARHQADKAGFQSVVESSDRSEAKYLYVKRNAWFGYRLACHLPVYDCSKDYFQVIVPANHDADIFSNAERYLTQAILTGGNVVAAPDEVEETLKLQKDLGHVVDSNFASRIRHQLNVRAAWEYEIMNPGSVNKS